MGPYVGTPGSSYLAWPKEVDVNIGVPSQRIDAVFAEVFAHILRSGLRQQSVDALPATTHSALPIQGTDQHELRHLLSANVSVFLTAHQVL